MQMLNISAAITYGWEKFKKMPGYFIGLVAIVFLISILPSFLQAGLGEMKFAAMIAYFAGIVLQLIVSLGLIKVLLAIYNGAKPKYGMLFDEANKIGRYFVASILYGLIVVGGLILFIVPGIIWSIKYKFYPYFIVEKNAGIWESMLLSGKATDGNKWTLLGLGIVLGLINLGGALLLGLGLLVTVPVTMLAGVYAYKVLAK